MSANGSDVVVVGGGVIGLACAWRCAQRGLRVSLVDPAPGSGASHAAAGMLAPVTEVHYGEEPLLALNLASADQWPSFAAELEDVSGSSIGFRTAGTVLVGLDADDRAVIHDLFEYQHRLGLAVERLRSRDARAIEPMLSPATTGGLLAAGDHCVDPRALTAALVRACERSGVEFVACSVVALERHRDGVSIALDDGVALTAATVVVAAGCHSARLAELPVRPVKGQILTLRGPVDEPILTRSVRGIVKGSSIYLVPRDDGRLVVGATVEEKEWDTAVTAGGVYELLRDATLLVPGVSELELVETSAGLRPATPDNAPVIGPVDVPGADLDASSRAVIAATGHFRNGVLLTPVTSQAIAELVATASLPDVAAPFSVERFA